MMHRYMDFLEFSTAIVKFLGFYSNLNKIRTELQTTTHNLFTEPFIKPHQI